MEHLSVLVVCFEIDSRFGSEAGVGYSWTKAISDFADISLVTPHRSDFELGEIRLKHLFSLPKRWYHPLRESIFWKLVERSPFKVLYNLAYLAYLSDLQKLVESICEGENYDYVHSITYTGYRFIPRLKIGSTRLIVGPIGGSRNTGAEFLKLLAARDFWFLWTRDIINAVQLRTGFNVRSRLASVDKLIFANEIERRNLRKFISPKTRCFVQSEICLPNFFFHSLPSVGQLHAKPIFEKSKFNITWSGSIIHGKNLELFLDISKVFFNNSEYASDCAFHIIGDGPERQRLQIKYANLKNVIWHSHQQRENVKDYLDFSDIALHVNVKELTSTSLAEYMACGTSIIYLNGNGAELYVNNDYGLDVTKSRQDIIQDAIDLIEKLICNPEVMEDEKRKNREVAMENFSFSKLRFMLSEIYES